MNKVILSIVSSVVGGTVGAGVVGKLAGKSINKSQSMSDKHLALFLMMNQWVKVKQDGKNLAAYLKKNGYSKIAIYGMSYAGETFLNELKGTEIEVAYGIDKKAEGIYADINVVTMDQYLDKVDAVVVTAITFFDEIRRQLEEKLECPIISLEDVLYGI